MVAALASTSASTDNSHAQTSHAQTLPARAAPSFFHRLLSELNPLQYVPVVGTIYRAVTGDVIPESARFAGSLVVSGLTSGPIGVAINLGASALERLTGVDPEAIGTHLLADLGIGDKAAPAKAYAKADTKAVPSVSAAKPAPTAALPGLEAGSAGPWSVAQLTAYGVVRGADGALARGVVSGADVLNSLELSRLGHTENGGMFASVA